MEYHVICGVHGSVWEFRVQLQMFGLIRILYKVL